MDTRWFRDRLADRGMSQRALARHMGLDAAAISLMLRGRRTMKLTEAAEIARLLGVPAEDVIAAAGVRISSGGAQVPVVGWIDGQAEMHWEPAGETVPHPGGHLPANVSAVQCRTASTALAHMDGWMLFADLDAARGVPADAIGRLSLCKLAGGVMHLATLARSYTRGRWDLAGPAADARAVDLEFAVPVLMIIP